MERDKEGQKQIEGRWEGERERERVNRREVT